MANPSDGCTLLVTLARLFGCAVFEPQPGQGRASFSLGRVQAPLPDGAFPPTPSDERELMLTGNVGQRVGPLEATWFEADGTTETTIDGSPAYSTSDAAIAEVRDGDDGLPYAYLLAPGTCDVLANGDADRTAGVRLITLSASLTVNDPATEATTGKLDLGNVQDVAAAPAAPADAGATDTPPV
jgi:hypothetical protein